jgi:SAM-dependent methyltransferase
MKGLAAAGIVAVWVAVAAGAQRPTRAPDIFFVPTWEPVVYQMLDLAGVTKDDVVYDLGSGDGRIVILAAQKYGARGVGIELDPRLVEISRQVARDARVDDRVRFIEGDLFTSDISDATVVTLFLSPSVNNELEPKLRRDLKPGTRIVSHQFTIGKWPPEKTVRAEEDRTNLYLWRVPGPDRLDATAVFRTRAASVPRAGPALRMPASWLNRGTHAERAARSRS